jgi:hypothetical protein
LPLLDMPSSPLEWHLSQPSILNRPSLLSGGPLF